MKKLLRYAALVVLAVVLSGFGVVMSRRASDQREWTPDGARVPEARFAGERVTVRHVRNFEHRSEADVTERWEERTYDLSRLESVWYWVVPFGDFRGPAHTFVSFGFADPARGTQYVAVSVEARKERGEHYHPVTGMLRAFELMYVVGDERDLVRLRANVRKDSVFLYRVQTTPEKGRQLFRAMLERANALRAEPEFYNTVTSSCTTNIVDHVNAIAPERVPFSYKVLLPAFADELAYDIGLFARTRPFAELRRAAYVSDRSRRLADDPAYSIRLREGL
ncbi:MAG TPA: DUF4105 domain-containing protein [Gemmatimonadaceae bacterium]|nr:DUF4105 domain-containing protein [Gemmatimonadaceae bacterium]